MRLLLLSTLLFIGLMGEAQKYKGPRRPSSLSEEFLKTQFWIGLKFGGNLTGASVTQSYSGITPIDYDPVTLGKDYQNYNKLGGHAGIDLTLYHRGFSVGIQPNYRVHRYAYDNQLRWISNNETFERTDQTTQKLDLFEMPLFIKYDIIQGTLRPYVMIGASYSWTIAASKTIQSDITDESFFPPLNLSQDPIAINNKDHFVNGFVSALAGAGVSYDISNIRLIFELAYRHQFGNVTDPDSRYAYNELASIGDVPDDLALRNLSASISFLFPLRFISSDYAAY